MLGVWATDHPVLEAREPSVRIKGRYGFADELNSRVTYQVAEHRL